MMRLEDVGDKVTASTYDLIDGRSIQIGAAIVCLRWSSDSDSKSHDRLQRLLEIRCMGLGDVRVLAKHACIWD